MNKLLNKKKPDCFNFSLIQTIHRSINFLVEVAKYSFSSPFCDHNEIITCARWLRGDFITEVWTLMTSLVPLNDSMLQATPPPIFSAFVTYFLTPKSNSWCSFWAAFEAKCYTHYFLSYNLFNTFFIKYFHNTFCVSFTSSPGSHYYSWSMYDVHCTVIVSI